MLSACKLLCERGKNVIYLLLNATRNRNYKAHERKKIKLLSDFVMKRYKLVLHNLKFAKQNKRGKNYWWHRIILKIIAIGHGNYRN